MNLPKTLLLVPIFAVATLTALAQQVRAPATAGTPPATPPVPASTVTSSTATAATTTATDDNDIVQLSPFQVTAPNDDRSYFSAQTISSGRIATNLDDIAANVDVITKAQLEDMGATDLSDLLAVAVSTQEDIGGEFGGETINNIQWEGLGRASTIGRARGLPLTGLVDYEPFDWSMDFFNVERVDFFLGTDAILFGNGQPGGSVNFTKDSANMNRTWLKANYRFGSLSDSRFTLDLQSAIIRDKLAVRYEQLNASTDNSFRKGDFQKRNIQYLTATFKPFKNTTITANYEHGNITRHQVVAVGMMTTGNNTLQLVPLDSVSAWWNIDDPAKYTTTANPALGTSVYTPNANLYLGGRNTTPGLYPLGVDPSGNAYALQTVGNLGQVYASLPDSQTLQPTTTAYPYYNLPLDIYDSNKYSIAGPSSRYGQQYRDFRVTLDQRLAQNLYLRTYYRAANSDQTSRFFMRNSPVPTIYADPIPSTGADDPFSGRMYATGNWRYETTNNKYTAFNAALAYSHDFGNWLGRHNVSLVYEDRTTTYTRLRYQEMAYTLDADGNAIGQKLIRVNYFDPNNSSTWNMGEWTPVAPSVDSSGVTNYVGFLPIGDQDNSTSTIQRVSRQSFTANVQSFWLKDRLVTNIGYRRDYTDNLTLSPQYLAPDTPAPSGVPIGIPVRLNYYDPQQVDDRVKNKVESMGASAVLHLNKGHNLSLFAGYSGNASDRIAQRVLPDGQPPGVTPRATTLEYGVRLSFLDDKISARISAYNVKQTDNYVGITGFWNQFTRAGSTATANPPALTIQLPVYNGTTFSGTIATETFNGTARALDAWADAIHTGKLITDDQYALYNKQLGRVYSVTSGTWVPGGNANRGVGGVQMNNKSEGAEVGIQLRPWKGASIRINYTYTKPSADNTAQDAFDWLSAFYGYVQQLPASVLNQPFNINGVFTGLANANNPPVNRPASVNYTTGQVFDATFQSLYYWLDDWVTQQEADYGNRRHKLNIAYSQNITRGPLKGFRFGGAYVWQSGMMMAHYNSLSDDGRSLVTHTIWGPSYWTANGFIAYGWNTRVFNTRVRLTAQINIQNIFRDDYTVLPTRVPMVFKNIPNVGLVKSPLANADGSYVISKWNFANPRAIYAQIGVEF